MPCWIYSWSKSQQFPMRRQFQFVWCCSEEKNEFWISADNRSGPNIAANFLAAFCFCKLMQVKILVFQRFSLEQPSFWLSVFFVAYFKIPRSIICQKSLEKSYGTESLKTKKVNNISLRTILFPSSNIIKAKIDVQEKKTKFKKFEVFVNIVASLALTHWEPKCQQLLNMSVQNIVTFKWKFSTYSNLQSEWSCINWVCATLLICVYFVKLQPFFWLLFCNLQQKNSKGNFSGFFSSNMFSGCFHFYCCFSVSKTTTCVMDWKAT